MKNPRKDMFHVEHRGTSIWQGGVLGHCAAGSPINSLGENVPRGTSWNINLARRGFGTLRSWFPYKLFGRECSTWNIVERGFQADFRENVPRGTSWNGDLRQTSARMFHVEHRGT
ncbi:MAG: hypothetical protein KA436_06260, partial [Oligoflexales bacterium]|nr:hypothetical protein [Oligoflexales bacterium]